MECEVLESGTFAGFIVSEKGLGCSVDDGALAMPIIESNTAN
jgi:hypothetical protein